ncbi:MAG: hypothetical protein KC766_30670 [Myxococcales bacterium]|nr:hypothetical protein [Myxococcales bacterium]
MNTRSANGHQDGVNAVTTNKDRASEKQDQVDSGSRLVRYAAQLRSRSEAVRADLLEIARMPVLTINLMLKRSVDNDPFYAECTRNWFADATRRHPKLPLIRSKTMGCAVCVLPRTRDDYFMYIEASARRNYKKAVKAGYRFAPLDFNANLDAVAEIRQSTPERQGAMPESYLRGEVQAHSNPKSRNAYHDYPYFGVFLGEKLVAYSSCFVSGELCSLQHILGHADFQSDGIVPMMLVGIAGEIYERYPAVRYFMYGTYFGAGPAMRRFKKKFRFYPHRVIWRLDARETL